MDAPAGNDDQNEPLKTSPTSAPPTSTPAGSGPTTHRRPQLRRLRTIAGILGGVLLMLFAVWLVDANAHGEVVDRNISVGGVEVAGQTRAEVTDTVAALAQRYRTAPVTLSAPGGDLRFEASDLGLSLDGPRTVDEVMAEGHRGFVAGRFVAWAKSFVAGRSVPVSLNVDESFVYDVVAAKDPQRMAPTEPSITSKDGRVVAVAGSPGRGIDPRVVIRWLRERHPVLPLRLKVDRASINPRFDAADANGLVASASGITRDGLKVKAGTDEATVPPEVLRNWLGSQVLGDHLAIRVVADKVPDDLQKLLPDAGRKAVEAGFTVSGSSVSITPSAAGTACCSASSAGLIEAALLNGSSTGDRSPVELPLRPLKPTRDEAALRKLGVVEPVATFTTNHKPGEPRVHNIHQMADIVRGAIIDPGATFSLNNKVGERTTAKGFVDAPVIDDKTMFSTDIGGGVSQFSTTLFNAAFFGGLDITTYGMHGLYISRYPYGREATLDYPSLDLKVRNSTPYGVLIWTTYTDTSITVTLYSTRTVVGDQTGQTTEPKPSADPTQPCTRVVTERTRTYPDGRKVIDKFSALYSPKEGIKCQR